MKKMFGYTVPGLFLLLLIGLLYGHYVSSPGFFDDVYFFTNPTAMSDYLSNFGLLDRRWITSVSLGLNLSLWGVAPESYRVVSMLLHATVAISLFVFLSDLLEQHSKKNSCLPALSCAVLFSLHPVATFASGYIIERSILLAAVFSLWMWIAVYRGMKNGSPVWLLLSCIFYYGAVFSKEHAVTALPVALLVAWYAAEGNIRNTLARAWIPLLGWCTIALAIILRMRGLLGSAYEPIVSEMTKADEDPNSTGFLIRSMVNQGYLFFKYALLWLLPNENWMAIDMREPFPQVWHDMPWIMGLMLYLAYPAVALWLYCRKHISRLLFVGLLSPWLLYLVQFSTVMYQESFVLYRSYLWAVPAMLIPATIINLAEKKVQILVSTLFAILFFGLSWSRLQTFSHPFLLWDEAVQYLKGRDELPGGYRIYHNRGLEYVHMGNYDKALSDFNKVVSLKPTYGYVYNDRGYVYYKQQHNQLALNDFQRAIDLKPNYPRSYVGKGLVLIAMNRSEEGLTALSHACDLGYGCSQYRAQLQQKSRTSSVRENIR